MMDPTSHILEETSFRDKMKNYWQMYDPSVAESTMHYHDAESLAENELEEILCYLPSYRGMRVLELGSGTGQFTSRLAKGAHHVTTIDFIQENVDRNVNANGHHENVAFKCADITELNFPPDSYDLVFSNCLFVYLSNEETEAVFSKILEWLSPEGYFFLRESCYHQSVTVKRKKNPTIYRTPYDYCYALENAPPKDGSAFKIVRGKSIAAYIKHHCNPNQLCFLAKKTEIDTSDERTQVIKDRYSLEKIYMGERLIGHLWFSIGAERTCRELCCRLNLRLNQRVLDVGCGAGAATFFMARQYGVQVDGVDLSPNMIHLAIQRQGNQENTVKNRVCFEINDILNAEYESDTYDVIHSRDVILYIPEKRRLFQNLYRWLKPGGKLFFTDFCRGPNKDTDQFLNHTYLKRWSLNTIESHNDNLRSVGFEDVQSEEMREELIRLMQTQVKSLTSGREAFVEDFSQEMYDSHLNNWNEKIQFAKDKQFTWAVFSARKCTTLQ